MNIEVPETQAHKDALEAYFTALPDGTIKKLGVKDFWESDRPKVERIARIAKKHGARITAKLLIDIEAQIRHVVRPDQSEITFDREGVRVFPKDEQETVEMVFDDIWGQFSDPHDGCRGMMDFKQAICVPEYGGSEEPFWAYTCNTGEFLFNLCLEHMAALEYERTGRWTIMFGVMPDGEVRCGSYSGG